MRQSGLSDRLDDGAGVDSDMKSDFLRQFKRAASSPLRRLARLASHAAIDSRGSVAVLAAVLFPVIIGGIGLGAETGYWYVKQRQLQHTADIAAHAAGTRKRAGDSSANIRAAALQIARKAGFDPAAGTLTVNTPPASGTNQADPDALEVLLSSQVPRLFSSIFSRNPVVMQARAVALVRDGTQACVLALSPSASGAVTLSGSSLVDLNGCDLASNSLASNSILMSGGSASLAAGCVYAVGEIVETTRLTLTECTSVKEYAPVTADPYANVPEPANVACDGRTDLSDTTVTPTLVHPSGMSAMRFCAGLHVTGTVTFNPGLYIISGGTFSANANSHINGTGVTFFIASSSTARLNGTAELDLSPPTTGPYSGLIFFGSRSGVGLTNQVNGNSGSIVDGAVYFPASAIEFSGNSKVSGGGGCTQVIGFTVTLTGNSSLRSSCALSGTRTLLANRFVRLVE